MTKAQKIDLLYKKAHGQALKVDGEYLRELSKYRVDINESPYYATKSNIKAYVEAVDNGCFQTFSDWCQDNLRADRRRKGSSRADMAAHNKNEKLGIAWMGWLIWGIAIYWLLNGAVSVGVCALLGIAAALLTFKLFGRRMVMISQFLLPIVLAVLANKLR